MSIFSLIITCLIFQQSTAIPPMNELFFVESDDTVVRCGAAENYYAFKKVPTGSIIHVVDNKVNWGRVPATGPVFEDAWGWIRQPINEPGRFTVLADGTGRTLDTTAVFAADISDPSPQKAWRQVCMFPWTPLFRSWKRPRVISTVSPSTSSRFGCRIPRKAGSTWPT